MFWIKATLHGETVYRGTQGTPETAEYVAAHWRRKGATVTVEAGPSNGQRPRRRKVSKARAFGALWAKAQDAGLRAAQETRPTPMIVQQHASPLNDASPVVQEWTVPGGVCGFAWIVIQPGTSSFARWAKKTHGAMRHWVVGAGYRGLSHWIGEHGQSMERKEAHAHAMAKVLREGLADLDPKVEVYAQSRMD